MRKLPRRGRPIGYLGKLVYGFLLFFFLSEGLVVHTHKCLAGGRGG